MDADLNNVLDTILGFSVGQINRMTNEGMTDASEIAGTPKDDLLEYPEEETNYRNEHGELGARIFDAPYVGEIYDEDALTVLQKVRDWTYSGFAKAYIENEANVQNAWANLLQQYEGADSITRQTKKANDALTKLHYAGEKMNFTFQDYCSRHIEHNQILDKFGDNQRGEMQVNRFFEGIRDNLRQQVWLTIRGQVMNDTTARDNLIRAIEKTKQALSDLGINLQSITRGQRRIGSMNQNNNYRNWRGGGRGRGRGRGCWRGGGRHGRGGRGQGRGQGQGDGGSNSYIDQAKLDMLNARERKMLFTGREVLERQEREAQMNNDDDDSRCQQGGAASMPPPPTEDEQDLPPPPEGQAPPTRSAASRFAAEGCDQERSAKHVHYQQTIDAIVSSVRHVGRAHYKPTTPTDYTKRARIEIDSRADTFCGGSTCKLDEETGDIVDVSGFHSDLGTLKGVQIGRLITAYDLPSGETIILVFNEGLYFGDKMKDSLLPPAQLWDYNITCNIMPKSKSNGKSIFGIYSPQDNQYLPFNLHGCIAYLPSRLPTPDEEKNCRKVVLTSERPWKPYSSRFKEVEDAADAHFKAPYQGMFRPSTTVDGDGLHLEGQRAIISSVTTKPIFELEHDQVYISSMKTNQESEYMDSNFYPREPITDLMDMAIQRNKDMLKQLDQELNQSIGSLRSRLSGATLSKLHRNKQPIDVLARRWGVSIPLATETIKVTTQRGIRTTTGPLTRRFRTRQKQLQIPILNTKVFTDTLFHNTESARGNTCAQLSVRLC